MPKKDSDQIFGFGSCTKRFNYLGIHPQLIRINETNPLGPGQYYPKRPRCGYINKSESWKIKLESEEFSKFLGFKNTKILCERLFYKTLGGPGTYDSYNYGTKLGASSFKNVGFGIQKRFHNVIKDKTLPPGVHNIKKLTTKFTKTPTFEWDGCVQRFKSREPSYKKAPNRYHVKQPCITEKIVSKRGPYDTFTGPRDQTTIKNHFAPPLFKAPDAFYDVQNTMDHLLHHPTKKRCGRFLLAERFPEAMTMVATKKGFSLYQRDEEFPGPANYSVLVGVKEVKKSKYPFNSSNKNARVPTNWKIQPGPDRYKVRYPTCHKKEPKNSWMFLSKATRELAKVESYSNFIY